MPPWRAEAVKGLRISLDYKRRAADVEKPVLHDVNNLLEFTQCSTGKSYETERLEGAL